MQRLFKTLSTFHALCFSLILMALCIVWLELIPSYGYYFLLQSTFVFLLIGLVLSAYFNKSKLFVLLLFPLFFNLALAFPTTLFTKLGTHAFWYITPLSFSLGYLFIYTLQERGLKSSFGLIRFSLGVIILGISFLALKFFSPAMQKAFETSFLHVTITALFKAPDFVVIMGMIALVFIFLISFLFKASTQKAPLWMLTALLIPTFWWHHQYPFILFSFMASLIAIVALMHDAYQMAYVDTLTGVKGRRALEESFLHLGSTYTIAMVDIDHFKKFNDTFGHDIGDEVLKLVATLISEVPRAKVYRYGGEEFALVFHSIKSDDTLLVLEDLRGKIVKRGFVIRDKNRPATKKEMPPQKEQKVKKERLSVSIGFAHARKGKSPQEILKLADIALYKAKESGRNCVISA